MNSEHSNPDQSSREPQPFAEVLSEFAQRYPEEAELIAVEQQARDTENMATELEHDVMNFHELRAKIDSGEGSDQDVEDLAQLRSDIWHKQATIVTAGNAEEQRTDSED